MPQGYRDSFQLCTIAILELIFFLTDMYTLQNVQAADIHNITWSDHAPLTIEVVDASKTSHKPLWRNNTFLLSHPKLRDEVEEKLKEFF